MTESAPTESSAPRDGLRQKTFLSTKVHHLVCTVGSKVSDQQEKCLLDNGLLDWDTITEVVLQDDIGSWNTRKEFVDTVGRLAPVCHRIHETVMALSLSDMEDRYGAWYQWTGCPHVFVSAFRMLKELDNRGPTMSLLLITSALERALGDVYLLKNQPCPSLLKDLLVTPELQDSFGVPALFCLRILMGPPTSLNLRNIVWHGFASPGEVSPRYCSFLLVLAASLGYRLHSRCIPLSTIPHREQVQFSIQTQLLKDQFPDLDQEDLCKWNSLLQKPSMCDVQVPMWELAVEYYQTGRYGWCLMILCPLLENLIRLVFASVNQCPERVLTAESTVLFTTFDEMLCSELPDGQTNLLTEALSEPGLNMLLDLLVHPEGPRLRDRISHGEVAAETVSRELVSFTMSVFLSCSLKTLVTSDPTYQKTLEDSLVVQLRDRAASYASVFHPLSACRCALSSLVASLDRWSSLPRPRPEDLDLDSQEEDGNGGCDELVTMVVRSCSLCSLTEDGAGRIMACITHPLSSLEHVALCLRSLRLQTLFRPHRELGVAGLLRQVAAQCLRVSDQVCCLATQRFGQWQKKELRSRQRTNYQRFLRRLPWISTGVRFTLLLLISHLSTVSHVHDLPSQRFHASIKFLKVVLQYSENLATYTSIERNKWDEGTELTQAFLQRVKKYYDKIEQQQQQQQKESQLCHADTEKRS